ncbi:restriction endonuclease subunit S [Poseidonibacter ostreae]|nr:restriction endonuclease subunit S [Poseidonibacter ostreae]
MNLENKKWKEFNFTDIFDIKGGYYNKKPKLEKNGNIPFIGAVDNSNGITEFYSIENIDDSSKTGNGNNHTIDKKIFKGNCICVTNNGSVGYAYYQLQYFTCSHDVNPLYLKNYILSKDLAMFIIGSIEKQRVCFQYSRKWRPKRMVKSKILLPVNKDDEPDYKYMEEYTKSKINAKKEEYKRYAQKKLDELVYEEVEPLENKEWKEYFVTDIFDVIKRGKRLTKSNQENGNMPYISSTGSNNGIDNFIGNNKDVRIFNNCLTIANSGSVGSSFYHPYAFIGSDHVTGLKKDCMSEYEYMFISTLTNRFSEKYNFNREINDSRISREKILLPMDENEKPDHGYMKQYMINMIHRKLTQYLKYSKN